MYQVALKYSLFRAQADDEVLPTTIPTILADAANSAPEAEALVEAKAVGEIGRR